VKYLLVDDHPIVRSGLRRLMQALGEIEVVEADNGRDAFQLFLAERPDVALVDVNLPGMGGFQLLRRLLAEDPRVKVLMFSMHAEPLYAAQALAGGALGYVSKTASPEEILEAIRGVADGTGHVERRLAQDMAQRRLPTPRAEDGLPALKGRELEWLRLVGEGRALSDMAEAMGVSYKTAANSLSLLKSKLGVSSTAELVRIALRYETSSFDST
jgi:DNA-binding NarL/FixJ family response regulator